MSIRSFVLAVGTALLCSVVLAQDPKAALGIDTPTLELLENPRTRPVIEKHLPQLAKRMLEDSFAAELLGSSSPRELSIDPHVRGITDAMLKAIQADLAAAQQTSAQD
ncbi:MAG: hypothetical protein ACREUC_06565 [Steroidobacteraceae bacterium]